MQRFDEPHAAHQLQFGHPYHMAIKSREVTKTQRGKLEIFFFFWASSSNHC